MTDPMVCQVSAEVAKWARRARAGNRSIDMECGDSFATLNAWSPLCRCFGILHVRTHEHSDRPRRKVSRLGHRLEAVGRPQQMEQRGREPDPMRRHMSFSGGTPAPNSSRTVVKPAIAVRFPQPGLGTTELAGRMQLDSRLPPHPALKRHGTGLSPKLARQDHRPVRRASLHRGRGRVRPCAHG